jgi:hypothetical protein
VPAGHIDLRSSEFYTSSAAVADHAFGVAGQYMMVEQ